MTGFRVFSEIGRLRRVLTHRPGLEIDRMAPTMMEHLLFDDILDGLEARQEHEMFCSLLRHLGVEVLEAQDLLAEVVADHDARESVFETLMRYHGLGAATAERLADLPPPALAAALIEGVRTASPDRAHVFDLLPVPNYFFQRDPQIVLGDRVMISSMATEARDREPLLARAIFSGHPVLSSGPDVVELRRPRLDDPDVGGPAFPFPSIEGGDVLVASPEVVLVGISERTNRFGVEVLAERLRRSQTSFRHLIVVEMPARRAYMHLDTIFTIIDRDTCLGYPAVISPDGAEAAHVSVVDLEREVLTFTMHRSLLETLAGVGIELEMVPCGGPDPLDQQREQWTDGANAFAVAPGLILLYHRNRRTTEALAARGWRVVSETEALAAADLDDGSPTVVTFKGRELSRARGGPRCMTMPLERDPLDPVG